MERDADNLTIGAFAREADVHVETIRFYQRKGLLPEPERPHGSIRRYGSKDVDRVRFIKAAQRLGFTLDEIDGLLKLEDGTQCCDAASLAAHRLADVRAKLADLQRIEAVLTGMVSACHASQSMVSCPLIASLQSERRDPLMHG